MIGSTTNLTVNGAGVQRYGAAGSVGASLSGAAAREMRLLSNLWLMAAAVFRRLGKVEQARGAIQEAEVRDEGNAGVWVQVGISSFSRPAPLAHANGFL
jgi:hypothetical protein